MDLTLEKCASMCYGTNFMGVMYGTQCYCGPSVNTAAKAINLSNCFNPNQNAYPCSGNRQEMCGGINGMAVYGRLIAIGTCPKPSVTIGGGSHTCRSVIAGPMKTA